MIDLSQHGHTHQQVLGLFAAPWGVDSVSYQIDVLRRGVKVRTLEHTKCTYDCDFLSEVKYSATIYAKDDPMVNWRTDFFRPSMTLHANGLDFVYSFTPVKCSTPADEIRAGVASKRLEAYDESVILQESSLGDELAIPAGTLYVAAVEGLIERTGIENINIIPSSAAISSLREDWTIDAAIMTVSNELLEEINYRSLEMGRDGILTSYRNEIPTAADAKIHYRADNTSVILQDKDTERDSYRRPNRLIGHVFNADMESPMRYEFVNDDPASPTSPTNNGGYVITQTREYNSVADYETLVANVQMWASEIEESYEYAALTTAILPHHEVREVLTVESQGVSGIYTETGWGFDNFGAGGKMTHNLRRLTYD